MVDATECAGDHAEGCLGVRCQVLGVGEESRCEYGCHARVLHAYLDGDGALLRGVELEQPANAVTQNVTECVVAEHDCEYEEQETDPVEHELRVHGHHHSAHDKHKPDDADCRHVRLDFLEHGAVPEEKVQQKPDSYGEDGYVQNIKEHSERVHVDARVCKPEYKQRSHDGRKQGRDCGHAYGVGHVALRQETHDVARNAARATAHEDDTDGEVGVESENLGERECHHRHDGVLRRCPEQNVERALEQDLEILHGEREPHAQHDNPEDDGGYVPVDPAEGYGEEECDDGACDDERGSVGGKCVAHGPDNFGHA